MKFALVNGDKAEATKGAKGKCSHCGSELIAKCGEIKIHHWAHKGNRNCDPWWENETEWHRLWKNNYATEWQEVSLLDKENNETHIADVRTSDGLVIEFQHSKLDSNERISREKFYKNMVWVIDGTRLKNDYSRFLKGATRFQKTSSPRVFWVDLQDECFPTDWLGSTMPVILDFKGTELITDPKDLRNHLYCLLPKREVRYTTLCILSRRGFIESTTSGEWGAFTKDYLKKPMQNRQSQQNNKLHPFNVKKQSPYILVKNRFVKRRRF